MCAVIHICICAIKNEETGVFDINGQYLTKKCASLKAKVFVPVVCVCRYI